MNYFGHAAVAALRGESAAFVLGAMLPDLAPMAGVAVPPGFVDGEVSRGVAFHVRTDALFHATTAFIELNRAALSALRAQGVSRGPARACAHMGVEMLIDRELTRDDSLFESYLEALHLAATRADAIAPVTEDEGRRFVALCQHLTERGRAVFATSEERFELRLGRTLSSRPRLRPTPAELSCICSYLSADEKVKEQVPNLLDELRPLCDDLSMLREH